MSILILTNIGSRDVLLNGEEIRPARDGGKRLFEEYDSCAAQLSFPIVESVMRYLLDRHPGETLDLYLFGTDQDNPKFQPTDTLYFARLMARRLPEVLGKRVRAWAEDVQKINPSYYDRAFEAYGRLLADLPETGISACYVALAGGIPACNTALLLQGVRRYGERLQVIYTPLGSEPIPIRVGEQILGSFREATALQHLQQLDFANALPLLRSLGVSAGLIHLAEYAARRLEFDFQAARNSLEEALVQGDEELRGFVIAALRHDLDILLGGDDSLTRLAALLRELNWNAAICWQHRRYADFLARVYRFQEAVLRYLVERLFSLPTDMGPAAREQTRKRWEEGIRAIPGLVEYFQSLSSGGEKLDWHVNGRVTHKALVAFALREGGEGAMLSEAQRKRIAALVERVNALDRLVELRHRTIVGHDFQGVSEEALLQASPPGKTPPDALDEIARIVASDAKLDDDAHRGPYEQIAAFLSSQLAGKTR
ncbi:MAG: hypothetical protein ACP5QU_09415 [Anaerolineae bacterium]